MPLRKHPLDTASPVAFTGRVARHGTDRAQPARPRRGLVRALGAALLAVGSASSWAAPATVCIAGTTPCYGSDLKAAISAAMPGAVILISAGEVTQPGIVVNKDITIRGQGAGQTIVQADATPYTAFQRVFTINPSRTAVIEDLTIRHGFPSLGDGGGGGISNGGNLTLNRVVVRDNATRNGSLSVPDAAPGGGVFNTSALTINHSTIAFNATGRGSDVDPACGAVPCNSGSGGNGGGVASIGSALTIRNSTVSNNQISGAGSCLNLGAACVRGAPGDGAGVKAFSVNDTLASMTMTANRGGTVGGLSAGLNVRLGNSIITGNINRFGEASDCAAAPVVVPRGYNLLGAGCATYANLGDVSEPDASQVLNPTLADNSGPTPTHALIAASPAINKANLAAPGTDEWACTARDQRGRLRKATCDIGAFEFDGDISNPTLTIDQALTQPDPTAVSPVRFEARFSEPVRGFGPTDWVVSATGPITGAVASVQPIAPYDGTRYEVKVDVIGSGLVSLSWLAGAATDFFGNPSLASTSTDNKVTVLSDSTPPVITPTLTGTLGANGWYTGDVMVSWSVVDDDSFVSVKSGCLPSTISSDTAGTTLTCSATSDGGTASRSVTVKRDATLPTVGGTVTPNPVRLGGTLSFLLQAQDATSGIAAANCGTPSSATAGLQAVECTATDVAGNRTVNRVPYTVQYVLSSFFSPAPRSKWKAGQTVPVKIALTDVNGVRIPDAEAAELGSNCRVAFAATGAQTGSGCLRYDAGNRQFIFNWPLGPSTGTATIAVAVSYLGSAVTTAVSSQIQITK